jgi:alkylation response protein AidB-like acyl-CoA dehydrogenase
MDFRLSPPQEEWLSAVRAVSAELPDASLSPTGEESFAASSWARCAAAGLTGLNAPTRYGGRGLDALDCALTLEAFGTANPDAGLTLALGAHLCAAVLPIVRHGSADQQQRWLPSLTAGWVGAGAMTEPEAGSDISTLATRAEPDGAGYRLFGEKTLVTGAVVADLVVVYAVTDSLRGVLGGITTFVLPASASGLTVTPISGSLGCRGAALGSITLDGVVAPADSILGGVGGGGRVFQDSMLWERTVLFAAWVGVQQRLLDRSVARARTRQQGGHAIGAHQAVAHRIADMQVRLEASRWLVLRAAAAIRDREPDAYLRAAVAKLFASEATLQSSMDNLRIHGGSGYLSPGPERDLRDAVGSVLYSGTSDIQRNFIARWLRVGR